ncbi:putative ribonuclease H-like domain-containing protein [Tanacetum coccineum]|uniref:Ribonuclease H-like domain-containing protein n=2 Tax=Tanacetum coccineum TaxID=301880 RepID=A0ABQ4X0D8_9ASTR
MSQPANDEFSQHLSDDEASNHEDASDTGAAPKQQQQVIPQTTAISNIKLPILKKEEYDIWAMEMEHYLEYIDNDVWKVIQNGNSKKRISTGKDGVVRILPPVSPAEIHAVEKERKARTILLMAIPKEHLRRFHGMDDAKEIWEAIRTRFGGNANSKKMQKAVLKQQFKRDSFYQDQGAGKKEQKQNCLLTMDDGVVNWGEHTVEEEESNHALMAISSSSEVIKKQKILAYSQAVKKLEAQLVTFQKQQLSLNEKLTFQANEIYEKDEKLKKYRRIGMKAVKEKEQLQKTLDSWKDSSKNLWRLIDSCMSSNKEDSVGKPLYSRFIKTNDFKGVSHPLSGDYTPKTQEEIDESLYVYGKKGPQEPKPNVSDDRSSEYSTCQSNDSAGSIGTSSEHSVDPESESSRVPPEVYVSTPITTNEKGVSAPKSKEVEPSCVSYIKTPRKPIKDQETPKVNRKNWNAMKERELGEGYSFIKKKCFVCGSLSHLIKDCDYYEKKMAREAEVKNQRVFNTCNRVEKPVWTNTDIINHANQFVPRPVQLNTCRLNINSVSPNINTGRTNINSVRPNINTGRTNVNPVRPRVNTVNSNVNTMPDESQKHLKVPRHHNMYSFDMKTPTPAKIFACLIAKAISDESKMWHRRLGHINFINLNKLVNGNLERGLPSKVFRNDHTCVSCHKGKQHKASCKAKLERLITKPLHTLYMDLFGPTSVKSINHASYFLVITDDCTRFIWVFFLASKDEISGILQNFIRQIETQLNHRVKIIRSDNGTEFKNRDMLEFCGNKGIKQEYSNARTPQQNGVAERMNRTLIKAARTMLVDSLLPTTFWAEAVSTACYIINRFTNRKLKVRPTPTPLGFTIFPKKSNNWDKKDIMMVQVYVDDIIFGSTKKSWCDEFEALMKSRFQMSSMGELTFFSFVKTAITPMETKVALTKDKEAVDVDVTPKTSHLNAVKRIFKWFVNFLDKDLLSLAIARSDIVVLIHTKAEYVAAANCYGQVLWVQNQLLDYGFNFINTKIHVDNESTICIVKNPVYHSKTKHIEIHHHFIRDCYEKKLISVEKIHTDLNVADLLTKPFDGPRFNFLVGLLCCGFSKEVLTSGYYLLPNNVIFEGLGHWGILTDGHLVHLEKLFHTPMEILSPSYFTLVYNFSKLIFDGMMANLKSKTKFLMYPHFLQLILDIQIENKHPYLAVTLTKKIFGNMKKGFRGVPRPLLPAMLSIVDPSAGQEAPSITQPQPSSSVVPPTPSTTQPTPSTTQPIPTEATTIPPLSQPEPPTPIAKTTTASPSPLPSPAHKPMEHTFEQPSTN